MADAGRARGARHPVRRCRRPGGSAQRAERPRPEPRPRAPGRAGPSPRTRGSRHDSEALAAIDAGADSLPPWTIGEIPLDRLAETRLECLARRPAELIHDLGRVDGIAQIVAWPVGHKGDELVARPDRLVGRQLV